ncbi:hypothetical protein GBA52_012544 [Prunus armeniaca]|nr:hypothetical protein GBA52_012544 [Prunus armeniaca]
MRIWADGLRNGFGDLIERALHSQSVPLSFHRLHVAFSSPACGCCTTIVENEPRKGEMVAKLRDWVCAFERGYVESCEWGLYSAVGEVIQCGLKLPLVLFLCEAPFGGLA